MVMRTVPKVVKSVRALDAREEVWLRIYAACAGALGCDGPTSRDWADKALEEFDKRFPPK